MTDEEIAALKASWEKWSKQERREFVQGLIKAWGREEFLIALATAAGKEVEEIELMIKESHLEN